MIYYQVHDHQQGSNSEHHKCDKVKVFLSSDHDSDVTSGKFIPPPSPQNW